MSLNNGPVSTVVHLLRHGEVDNPGGILYGRLDGFHLSARGRAMADKVAEAIAGRDITVLRSSPLERAQETIAPLAGTTGLEVDLDPRLLESTNVFEGRPFTLSDSILRRPSMWRHLWNPARPSWGEPYVEVAGRMLAAVQDAREAARGHEAVLVSHQLPIWTTRLAVERKSFIHNPRSRRCTLCSLTSLHFADDRIVRVTYSEPAGDLIPAADRKDPFSAGRPDEERLP